MVAKCVQGRKQRFAMLVKGVPIYVDSADTYGVESLADFCR